uniref:Uncharacterized protein n=1 Tax=Tetranychus urticae TaxID=32264 RepID=T1L3R8_TETUR
MINVNDKIKLLTCQEQDSKVRKDIFV